MRLCRVRAGGGGGEMRKASRHFKRFSCLKLNCINSCHENTPSISTLRMFSLFFKTTIEFSNLRMMCKGDRIHKGSVETSRREDPKMKHLLSVQILEKTHIISFLRLNSPDRESLVDK